MNISYCCILCFFSPWSSPRLALDISQNPSYPMSCCFANFFGRFFAFLEWTKVARITFNLHFTQRKPLPESWVKTAALLQGCLLARITVISQLYITDTVCEQFNYVSLNLHHSQTRYQVLGPGANFLLKKPKEISFAGSEFEILIKESHVFKNICNTPNWKKKNLFRIQNTSHWKWI